MPTIEEDIYEIGQQAIKSWRLNKIYVFRTPLIPAKQAGKRRDVRVFFKLENFQLTGSYHFRGAMSRMLESSSDKPLVTASTGNHAMGTALAAHALGRDVTIVLPKTVAPHRLQKVRSYGPKIIIQGNDLNEARQHAALLAQSRGHTYFSPYNDRLIVAGQGTVAVEILQQFGAMNSHADNIFVPMGGGALISGIGCFVRDARRTMGKSWPNVKVWGVAAMNSMALAASLSVGFMVKTEDLPTLAESESNDISRNDLALHLAMNVVDHVVCVSEWEIQLALRQLAVMEDQRVDGFAALGLAGFNRVAKKMSGQTQPLFTKDNNFCGITLKMSIDFDFPATAPGADGLTHTAQLYVTVHLFNHSLRYPFSFVIHNDDDNTWRSYRVVKDQTDRFPRLFENDLPPGVPGLGMRFFLLASIPAFWLREVHRVCRSINAFSIHDEVECSHWNVRRIILSLRDMGVVSEAQVSDLFPRLHSISTREGDRNRYLL
ncbi:anabolic serine threonine dehydratase precursor [Fusarium heterosporum]|uniref:Anabolic serine threonine dehydratase n=1 Tax=Fusarium heterosporum TaxID=42747 RepID=A0A8H5WHT8_FUSHE|nr:anabolic serine threonine dehydratase precursor [Fusarium heterosporum]